MSEPLALYIGMAKADCEWVAPSTTDTEVCAFCSREMWVDPASRKLVQFVSGGEFQYCCTKCLDEGRVPTE